MSTTMIRKTSTGLLTPSRSHTSRRWHYSQDMSGESMGFLVIVQGSSDDTYRVTSGESAATFTLTNLSNDEQYTVSLSGRVRTCSGCHCGRHATCKHRDAVESATAAGAFDTTEFGDRVCSAYPETPRITEDEINEFFQSYEGNNGE